MKEHKPDYAWIAAKLEAIRTTQPDGTPAFIVNASGINSQDVFHLLATYEPFDPNISDIQRENLIRDAIRSAVRAGPLTAASLQKELSRQNTLYARQPSKDYVLVTSLSMKRPTELKRLAFDNAVFTFSETLPVTFSRTSFKFHSLDPPKEFPALFTKVRVRVTARSEFDAYEVAMNALDYLRGIWNFIINRDFLWRFYSGPKRPINSILLGPLHSLHFPTGEPATDTFWYEAAYPMETEAAPLKDWQRVNTHTRQIRTIIARHPYQDFLRQTFIRYARSLDSTDHESSLLKLWGVLEWLTCISPEQNYGEVIKRVVFLFEDVDYHKQILEHLRVRRNRSVHGGTGIFNAEALIYQLKLYVEWLIVSHIKTCGRYKTPQDFGQMLSSPLESTALTNKLDDLTKQIKLLRAAQKLRAKKDKPAHNDNNDDARRDSPSDVT